MAIYNLAEGARIPATHSAVTPHDTTNFTKTCVELYVGGAGDVAAVDSAGTAVTYSSVPAGTLLCGLFTRVNSTNTTATNIVARYID